MNRLQLARAALIGAATGSRTTFGVAALGLTARPRPPVARPLRIASVTAAGAEAVIDKLPVTPSRLQARGLVARVVAGAASGAVLTRRQSDQLAEIGAGALVASAAALGGAFVGSAWRRHASARFDSDLPGAVAEDLAAATAALVGVVRR